MTVAGYYNDVERSVDQAGTRAIAEKRRRHGQCRCYGYVYVIRRSDGLHKVGMTMTLRSRLAAIRAGLVSDVDIVRVTPTRQPGDLELRLHAAVRDQRFRGEWFRLEDDHLEKLAAMCDEEEAPVHEPDCIDAGLSPLTGDVMDPDGSGRWELATSAYALLGISQKTLYRRIERGMIKARRNGLGRMEVWLSTEVTPSSPLTMTPVVGETLTLAIVNELRQQREADMTMIVSQAERIAALERVAGRAELLTEQLATERERSAELQQQRDAAEARAARAEERQDDKPWWRWWWR